MILDELVAATQQRLAHNQARVPAATMHAQALAAPTTDPADVYQALRQPPLSIIAEVKAASPSKGTIAADFDPVATAQEYAAGGVNAISVLTEPTYFHGDINYLRTIRQAVTVPLLRKDFIIDDYMIDEAKAAGANLILLIVAILDDHQLRDYIHKAAALGLAVLVEAHDAHEIQRALQAGADIIGVNNRDLRDFTVDLHRSVALRPLVPRNVIFVSESGIRGPQDVDQLRTAGVDAILVGETLMRSPDKAATINALRGGAHDDN
ncbi:indole-3-glycerol phosphate synthase TrpC [uncultured Lacticaseibacillus sp.]|uniref:indole-3-glycerol phosphate synthase TrpC n=1 Tax=uncultured Lacticaseibacillus sp. TaxID=2775882 RepID=UPI0025928239|nr:indole-3-glycerol phosphate synthase TrpC [uncultured Lacticaseibacillus sp.]